MACWGRCLSDTRRSLFTFNQFVNDVTFLILRQFAKLHPLVEVFVCLGRDHSKRGNDVGDSTEYGHADALAETGLCWECGAREITRVSS